MATTTYPAFEAALAAGDTETLLRLYDLEHTLRARAEAEKAALLWQISYGSAGKAAEPGYLTGYTAQTQLADSQHSTQKEVTKKKSNPNQAEIGL